MTEAASEAGVIYSLGELTQREKAGTHDLMAFKTWMVGDIKITRVLEMEPLVLPPEALIKTDAQTVLKHEWLRPHFAEENGFIRAHVQAFILEAAGKRIMVDPCIGNDKERQGALFNQLDNPYLERLEAAGYPRETIDVVLCTHLHVDHCGWNTMLVDGKWVPTFPNAQYLFAREELEHAAVDKSPEQEATYLDSIKPIVDAGLAVLVDPNHEVAPGVRLEHTPGHTPGHCCVLVSSRGEEAIITGDLLHHPVQAAETDVCSLFCWDEAVVIQTRRDVLAKAAEKDRMLLGTHFAGPTGVRVSPAGAAWRVDPY